MFKKGLTMIQLLMKRPSALTNKVLLISAPFLLIAAAVLAASPRGTDLGVNAQARSPKIVALRIHHDLCPYCKALTSDPKFARLGVEPEDESVLFVTLDMSSTHTQRQSAMLLAALGLAELWPADLTALGTLTLVDWENKKVVASERALDVPSIRAALRKALSPSP
jgi:hypothetical protein